MCAGMCLIGRVMNCVVLAGSGSVRGTVGVCMYVSYVCMYRMYVGIVRMHVSYVCMHAEFNQSTVMFSMYVCMYLSHDIYDDKKGNYQWTQRP